MEDVSDKIAESQEEPPNAVTFGAANVSSIAPEELQRLTRDMIAALKTVYDPELPTDDLQN